MTIAREFAEYCVDLSVDDLHDETVEYTKGLLLDTLGTTVGGYHWSDSADVMVGAGRALHGTRGPEGTATVLATGDRLSPADAALVNGALSHSLDYDNRHSPGSLHIGSSVVTAALAAAETADADGETLLRALVAGYDVTARLGMACNPRSSHERGFHPTGTCGTFGATAAVGVVYGLASDELVSAFAVNGSQASGSYQCSITGGWNKRIHPGLAARNAFVAVALATNGFEGPPDPIEGDLGFLQAYADRPAPERATAGLGDVYEAARTKIKPYPVGTFAHVPLALLIDLATEEELAPDDVESIVVELPTSGAAMFGRSEGDAHPTSSAEAQFDMPFSAALAVVYREAGLSAFEAALSDDRPAAFDRVMDVTTTVASDELEAYLPELYPARVTVETATESYELFREWVQGEPDHPMTWDDLERKVADLVPALDADDRRRLVGRVRDLESTTGRELVDLLRTAG
ncbi:MmgE/PrpD family protein [Salinigranum rubrum]|uniref:MmgE/PrpD family protein n=1 Tax=Salinigranum rubrum TaxID=755307 RepID=A0A2I8VFS8_9EURY|nr:MmgE/PrpD family protein [Salinigranum rubrum]AUV80788.1 MmgE/PrpD family protein [Salinigranum rubrum]